MVFYVKFASVSLTNVVFLLTIVYAKDIFCLVWVTELPPFFGKGLPTLLAIFVVVVVVQFDACIFPLMLRT